MNNIALVFKTGGDYTPEYVNRLANSLAPFGQVTCLTDYEGQLACATHTLAHGWPGWWSKLELFEVFRSGRTVYFDLDTVVHGDISPLFELSEPFYMLSDFYRPKIPASGVMVWNGDHSHLTDGFTVEESQKYRTPLRWYDQGWISSHLREPPKRLQDVCPGLITSYKAHKPAERQASSIVCYHGQPRPKQTGWAI